MRVSPCLTAIALAGVLSARASAQSTKSKLSPNAPPDRQMFATAQCQWREMVKASEPYVVRARAAYPDAKRRFQSPEAHARPFFVTTRLADSASRHEQVFVSVDSIAGSRVYGTLASQIGLVSGYRTGQPFSMDESELVDWMFANADGSEEGNFVGKFIETYKSPGTCRDG